MKNLELFGVKELSHEKANSTDGGVIGWIMAGIATGYHVEYYKENGELKWWF